MRTPGCLTVDRALIIRSWDSRLAALTGISAAAAIGSSLTDHTGDLEARGILSRIRSVLDDGVTDVLAPALHQYLIDCPPRGESAGYTRMQQRVTLTPLRDESGITGMRACIEDVTARLDRERELATQLRSADEHARLAAAHELASSGAAAASLAPAFGDPSWRVRQAAVAGFADRGDEEVVAALTTALRSQHRDLAVLNSTLSALAIAGGDVVLALVRHLSDPDPDLRIYVALALGHMADVRAVAPLIAALDDDDVNVRFHVIEALGRLCAEEATAPLLDIVEERDFFLAFVALDALAEIGDASAADRLLALLADDDLRPAVIHTLGRIGDEQAVAPLAEALADESVPATTAASALAAMYRRFEEWYAEGDLVRDLVVRTTPPEGVRRLAEALGGASGDDLVDAALVLSWLPGERVDAAFTGALVASSRDRHLLIDALVQRGPAAVPALLEQLSDPSTEERKIVVAALGRIGSVAAMPALTELLEDPHADLVVVAAHALGSLGDPAACAPLIARLDDARPAVRQAAVSALNSLGHPDMPQQTLELLQSESPRIRESAARIAGYFGYPHCIDAMLQLCGDVHPTVRRVAIEHIGYLQDERIVPLLNDAMADESPAIRAAAARALGQVDSLHTVPLQLALLRDDDSWVRYQAARSAGSSPRPELVLTLCTLAAEDPHPPVRIAAIDALARIADPAAVRFLTGEAESAETEIAVAAIAALGRIGDPAARGTLVAALGSSDAPRRWAALEAIHRAGLTAGTATHLEDAASQRTDQAFARAAIAALGASDAAESLQVLVRLTLLPNRRPLAIAAMADMAERNPDVLAAGLRNPEPFARRAVVEAWGRSRNGAAARHLAAALGDADAKVRTAAAAALARLDLRAAEGRLRELARTPVGRAGFSPRGRRE